MPVNFYLKANQQNWCTSSLGRHHVADIHKRRFPKAKFESVSVSDTSISIAPILWRLDPLSGHQTGQSQCKITFPDQMVQNANFRSGHATADFGKFWGPG